MFSQIKVWKVTCEKCGKPFASDCNEIDYFHSKKEAMEFITEGDDWHIKNGKAYCDDCFVY